MELTLTEELRLSLGRIMRPAYPAPKITLAEAADLLGVSIGTVKNFLDGDTVSSDTLDRVAKFVADREGAPV